MSTTRIPTSSTASAANNVTPVTDKHGKAGKPDLYDGDRTKTDTWLLQLDLYFHCSGKEWEDKDKVILAATYMKGKATQWIGPYLTSYLNKENSDGDQVDEVIENYSNFRDRLKQLFGIANKVPLAERAIQALRQTRSAADYAAEFDQYAVQTKWDDEALMTMYKQALKKSVREELLRSGAAINTLKELYDDSIRIDADWYELNQELRRNPQNKPSFGYQPMGNPRATPHRRRQQRSYGYAPMEDVQFNHMRRGKGKGTGFFKPGPRASDGSQPKATETRTCFTCGKPGHIARNCRSKNKVYRSQLNVLTTGNHETDEERQVLAAFGQLGITEQSPTDLRLYEDPEESDEYQEREASHANEATNTYLSERLTLISKEQREWADLRYANQSTSKTYAVDRPEYMPQYDLDHRNPAHGLLHWTICDNDQCSIHFYENQQRKKQPKHEPRCRWEWFDCPITQCDEHLWDKRKNSFFPHLTDTMNKACTLLINGQCTQPMWQLCQNPGCTRHKDLKQGNGFDNNPQTATTTVYIEPTSKGKGEASREPQTPEGDGDDETREDRRKKQGTRQRQRARLRDAYRTPELDNEETNFLGQRSGEKTPLQN